MQQFAKREENGLKSQWFKSAPLKPPGKKLPFAFITSALPFPALSSTLQAKFAVQDETMLHEPIINCWRRAVNQVPGFPAAQRLSSTPRWSQRRLSVDFMDGLSYTTIIEFAEPPARRRGSALDR